MRSRSQVMWGRSLLFVRTHRPGEAERQDHSGLGAGRGEAVAAQHRRGGGAKAAGASSSGLELELLQTDPEVGVTLLGGAAAVSRVPPLVAAGAAPKLTLGVLHGHHLQLKVTRGRGHLRLGRGAGEFSQQPTHCERSTSFRLEFEVIAFFL